jgi:16S rRNA (guanine966-N2)-methyltransferase
MRVISGTAKGLKLKAVPGDTTRPILDRVKVPLFDILRSHLEGITVLDLFAGTGQIGIECLSQGANHCIFLDLAQPAIETIKDNLTHTKLLDRAEVRRTDAFTYLRNCQKSFDLIYVAPPQFQELWTQALHTIAERPKLLNKNALVVAQIDNKEYETLQLSCLQEFDRRSYGSTTLVFYRILA